MCGIVGYIGTENAAGILTDGLEKLEYRGYDSAGIAVFDGTEIKTEKAEGRLVNLTERLGERPLFGKTGIGHTRWATHGAPCEANSHPHLSSDGKIAVVHNGIIENCGQLREMLESKGYSFVSETDTEVIPLLIEMCFKGDLVSAVRESLEYLEGSYALGIICSDEPDKIVAVRNQSPLIVGIGNGENFIASDIPAVLEKTRNIYYLEDGEIAVISREDVLIYNSEGARISKTVHSITFSANAAQKDGYEHFMLKEIHEQPVAVANTLRGRLTEGASVKFDDFDASVAKRIDRIYIIACGTAYHAGLVGKTVIEKLAKVPVEVELASEFRYNDPLFSENTLVIAVSQSGETADTLAGIRLAKKRGAYVLALTNVVGSSVSRESDCVFYTYAGPEISVASTKAYTTQLTAFYIFAAYLAEQRNTGEDALVGAVKDGLAEIPSKIQRVLDSENEIKKISEKIFEETDIYYLGRGLDYAVAAEGSLKLKEISYIHSETYAGGELKHGPIALISDGTVVVSVSTDAAVAPKTESNIKEVATRGAYTIVFADEYIQDIHKNCDVTAALPHTLPLLSPLVSVIPLQLLAYYTAERKGYDIDKPRNLAKSVTVE